MSGTTKVLWVVSLIVAVAIGWFAAMEVVRGPSLRDEQDAYERFSNAFTIVDAMDRIETVGRLVRKLTPETLPGAVRAYKEDVKDVYNEDFRMLLWYWGKTDPAGMLMEVQTWPELRAQKMAAGQAVYWTVKNEGFQRGRELLEYLPNRLRDQALPYIVIAHLENGAQDGYVDVIDAYSSREERDIVARIVAANMIKIQGPEALEKWVEGLPDGPGSSNDIKAVAFRAAQDALMQRDEFEFLEAWLPKVYEQPWANAGGWRTIGVHLAKRDPLRAVAWAEGLAPEYGRDDVLAATTTTFATHDRDGAVAWLRTQEPSPVLDAATSKLVIEFQERNPEISLEMLGRLRTPERFESAHRILSRAWSKGSAVMREDFMKRLEAIPPPGGAPAPADEAESAS